jgi:hypothetical protein
MPGVSSGPEGPTLGRGQDRPESGGAGGRPEVGQDLPARRLGSAGSGPRSHRVTRPLADWLDPELQRRRSHLIAEREHTGQRQRATVCAQSRVASGWECCMLQEGLIAEELVSVSIRVAEYES